MNVQEYRCLECGHRFPSHTPIGEERCPRCGGARLESNPWLLWTDAPELSREDYEQLVEAEA